MLTTTTTRSGVNEVATGPGPRLIMIASDFPRLRQKNHISTNAATTAPGVWNASASIQRAAVMPCAKRGARGCTVGGALIGNSEGIGVRVLHQFYQYPRVIGMFRIPVACGRHVPVG